MENESPVESQKEGISSCEVESTVVTSARYRKFDDFFKNLSTESKAAITMQPVPDPDALGAALGLQWLLEVQYGIVADLFSVSDVSHPQNSTAMNVLEIRLKRPAQFDPDEYDTVIVVDTVPQNTGFDAIVPKFHVIIDHHQFEVEADIVDIRTVGACSSMIWDYLRHFEMSFASERGVQVATALLFGIRNDTGGLLSENTCELDMKAHAELMANIDRKKLQEIIHYSFPSYIYELRAKAVESKVVKDSVLIAGLGILTSKKRDALPILADEFQRMEGIETVVVFAIIEDSVEASVRSHNSSVNVHDFCQRVFGQDHAGGKAGAGGASVPMGFLYNLSDEAGLRNEICEAAQKVITQRILDYLLG